MLRPRIFVGFTGHRLNLADSELISRQIHAALERIAVLTSSPLAAVSSLAIGGDTLFATAVQQRNIPWTLLLPFPADIFLHRGNDFPTDTDKKTFHRLAAQAVHTHIDPGFKSEAATEKSFEHGFLECGLLTVEECDVLIAVWNGLDPRGLGGTSRIVAYARELKKPVVWIHSETGEISEERFERLKINAMPLPATAEDGTPSREQVEQAFAFYDQHATSSAPWSRYLNIGIVSLHQFATAIAIAGLIWITFGSFAIWIKLGALGLALFLPWYFHHKPGEWIGNRMCAELCRSALAIWNLRPYARIFPAMRLPVFTSLQRSLLLHRLRSPQPTDDIALAKKDYAENRLQDQINYYSRQAQKAAKHRRWLKGLALTCTGLAILYGMIIALHWVGDSESAYKTVKLMSLSLPLIAAGLVAAATALDLDRRAARYREITLSLKDAKARLEARVSWEGVTDVVIDVERMLLLEIWEWYSVTHFSASAH